MAKKVFDPFKYKKLTLAKNGYARSSVSVSILRRAIPWLPPTPGYGGGTTMCA
jgi:hypothetical protein